MDLLEVLRTRRSIRKYTQEPIGGDKVEKILVSGLLSASSRGRRPWEFILVREKETLQKMSEARTGAAKMLEGADCAVVVIVDADRTDVWTEDASIAMSNMLLMAHSLGVGGCWIQGRLREALDGSTTEQYLQSILEYPENYRLEAILSLGMPAEKKKPYEIESLSWEKVHKERF
ncbi:MAG: nitroreductase family protein [Muricomes sp.]